MIKYAVLVINNAWYRLFIFRKVKLSSRVIKAAYIFSMKE